MIEHALHEEIKTSFEDLKSMKLGSEEHKVAVDEVTKLLDRAIEMEKLEHDAQDKVEERNIKLKQMNEERKDRWWRNGLAAAGLVVPTCVTIWGTLKSFKFEETGTVTTIMGRGFINKLLPKK